MSDIGSKIDKGGWSLAKGSTRMRDLVRHYVLLRESVALLRDLCVAALPIALLAAALPPRALAKETQSVCPVEPNHVTPHASLARIDASSTPAPGVALPAASGKLIVIGFMGGRVRADDLVHKEARMAKDLQQLYPAAVQAEVFANRDGHAALRTVLRLLDTSGDGCPSPAEKHAARIVIYGHSWGASQTVALARQLNKLSIPVLLTIQVDSVQKSNQNDGRIPPNVREAINFYQADGLLRGRSLIQAMDPAQTKILGNFESSYRDNPVSCAGYPWYARAFMRPHIEIENDPTVWNRIQALIQTKVRQR
jgi:hypothetical protein